MEWLREIGSLLRTSIRIKNTPEGFRGVAIVNLTSVSCMCREMAVVKRALLLFLEISSSVIESAIFQYLYAVK